MTDDDATPRVESQLCFTLYSTLHALNRIYAPLLEPLKLTYPQYLVMLVLWEGDDVAVKTIGERVFLDSGTLTPLLKRLEAAGLVARARDARDERQVRVKLTEAGSELRRAARCVPGEVARAMGRSPEEIKAVRKELRRIRGALTGKRDRPEKPGKLAAGSRAPS